MTEMAILVEGVKKKFGDIVALGGVDFAVPTGTVFGLLGPNGAGKTTAVRVLSTIIHPEEGRASVLGFDVVRQAEEVRYRIGLAGQYAAVDPNLTGHENLRLIGRLTHLPRKQIRPRADELLERFGLTDAAHRPVRTYSGGMRRRLDLSAALVHRPPVLFLDEPTTGLDLPSRNELWAMIREQVAEGTTVLLTTQYLEEADILAQRIAVIDRGLVVANDTPAALKSQLGATVIELGAPDDVHAAQMMGLLASFDPKLDDAIVKITADDAPATLIKVLRVLDDAGNPPTTVAVREPSLDDVFMVLTGHRAVAEEPTKVALGGKR